FSLGNDSSMITPLVIEIQRAMTNAGFTDRTALTRIGVAVHEAVTNAIEHGNLEADSELRQDDEAVYRKLVEFRRTQEPYSNRSAQCWVRIEPSTATITIRDEGPGFDPGALPDPNDPAQFERIGGRGLLLMRSFLDEVQHNAKGNQVTLVK